MSRFIDLIVVPAVIVGATGRVAVQAPADAALIANAKAIHDRVIKLDTHNDIEPSRFTPACNYTMRLTTQVNLPKMIEGDRELKKR